MSEGRRNRDGELQFPMIKIDKNKDLADLKTLLRRLEVEGRRLEEGNAFDKMLGDEKFPFQTRRIVQEIMSILQDSPEFVDEIPERLKHFFEGWNLPKTKTAGEEQMDKTSRIAERIAASIMNREAGGGISPSQLYERIRRGLQGMIRDISRKFPETSLRYADRQITGTVAGHDVEIFYNVLRASNGEVAGLPVINFDGKQYANIYGNIVDKLEELIGEPVVASSKIAARELVAAARLMNVSYDSFVMRGYVDELNRKMEMVRQVSTVLRSTIQKVGTARNNSKQEVSDSLVLAGEFSDNLAKSVSKLKYEIDSALDYVVRTFGETDQS